MPRTSKTSQQTPIGQAIDLKTNELDDVAGGLHFTDSVRTARKGIRHQQGRVTLDADYNE